VKRSQLGVQLAVAWDRLQTAKDLAESVRKVRSMGYGAVELAAGLPIAAREIGTILAGEGMACCGLHVPGSSLYREPATVIAMLEQLSCEIAVYPYPGDFEIVNAQGLKEITAQTLSDLVRTLREASRAYRAAGKHIAVHNHSVEFYKIEGKTVMERLFSETAPEEVQSELDTYWVQAGGCDPAEWCRKLRGRLLILHLKDYGVNAQGKPVDEELGDGNLDWRGIVRAARKAGCRWYVIEQDGNWDSGDPFLSMQRSYEYLAGERFLR
jgi:sugar phosphate isomerase/epimerase